MQHVAHDTGVQNTGVRLDELVDSLYQQLRMLARSERRRSGSPDTLHTTALVNELYLKLADAERLRFGEPRQFFSYAAQAMRHILIDRARLQLRLKSESSHLRVALTDPDVEALAIDPAQTLELDAALDALQARDQRGAEVVNLHFFAGLGLDQVAALLGVAPRTVARDWRFATAFLKARLFLPPRKQVRPEESQIVASRKGFAIRNLAVKWPEMTELWDRYFDS